MPKLHDMLLIVPLLALACVSWAKPPAKLTQELAEKWRGSQLTQIGHEPRGFGIFGWEMLGSSDDRSELERRFPSLESCGARSGDEYRWLSDDCVLNGLDVADPASQLRGELVQRIVQSIPMTLNAQPAILPPNIYSSPTDYSGLNSVEGYALDVETHAWQINA